MSARDDLIEIVTRDPQSSGGDQTWATDLVDAYRTEVLAKAIGRLRAIPVDCTALTGPVWYGDGWNSAITCLEEIADYQTPDDEAYPGELQRLRALALGLRVAALRKEDLAEAQQLLVVHAEHEMDVREKATTAAATATPELTVYRASHESIVFGHYTTPNAAWKHCEGYAKREFPAPFAAYWSSDEDGVTELMVSVHGADGIATGYVVTPLEVASEYDEEADE
jgi:hypothetical protein